MVRHFFCPFLLPFQNKSIHLHCSPFDTGARRLAK
nr:MAG TPA: hypothetical protein [Caudoviricetes sp.]